MIRKMTCIECPRSCALAVDIESCRVVSVNGHQCPNGEAYAKAEVENPTRILTGTIVAKGLAVKMVPVKIDQPILKEKINAAALEIKKMLIEKPVRIGEVLAQNLLGLGVNVVATRDVVKS